jgi:hypothetical protein
MRKLVELELIVRAMATVQPLFRGEGGAAVCAFCDVRDGGHATDCIWLTSKRWVRRNLP